MRDYSIASLSVLVFLFCLNTYAQDIGSPPTCATPNFAAGKSITVGANPVDIITADFNNDGKRDLAEGITGSSFGNSTVEIQLGDGGGNFVQIDSIPVPSFVTNLAATDFNGDGFLDLLVTHRWAPETNGITLLAGDGTGNFANVRTIPTSGELYAPVPGDFNRDDKMDFVVAEKTRHAVKVYFGDNAGGFTEPLTFLVGTNPQSMVKEDLNNDTFIDLVVANGDSEFVSVLYGNVAGTFNPPISVGLTQNYTADSVAARDLNGDGRIDLVVNTMANPFLNYPSGVSVLLGNVAGGFTLQPMISFEWGSDWAWLADLNADGLTDLLAGRNGLTSAVASVRLGAGNGSFGNEMQFTTAGSVYGWAIDDFDTDGHIDLIESGSGFAEIQFFKGNGTGRFGAPPIASGHTPNSVVSADFSLDGRPDVAFGDYENRNVVVVKNTIDGTFPVLQTVQLTERPLSLFSADYNGDALPDLGILTYSESQFQPGHLVIVLNSATGLGSPVYYEAATGSPWRHLRGAAFGDVTGDGIPDMVLAAVDDRGWLLLMQGFGNGTFLYIRSFQVGTSSSIASPWGVTIGDFNGDGKNDLAVPAAGSLGVFLGGGTGFFSAPTFYPVSNNPVAEFAMADFNHDGNLDAAIVNNSTNNQSPSYVPTVSILFGNGTGGFSAATHYNAGRGMASISVADLNTDTHPDLILSHGPLSAYKDNRVGIYYGSASGTFSNPSHFVAGLATVDTAVADLNADGRPDIVTPSNYHSDVTILLSGCDTPPSTNFPTLSISQDVTVPETNTGTTEIVVTATLSVSSSRRITADYSTSASTAVGTADYQAVSGKLIFEPGEVSKSFSAHVNGDLIDEFDENFRVFLTNPSNTALGDKEMVVTITDNDQPPTVSIGDLTVIEGSGGARLAQMPVTLSLVSGKPISVNFSTSSGTATTGEDFVSTVGVLTIPVGLAASKIDVTVNSDYRVEPDETFSVTIGNPMNVVLDRVLATATIANDDVGGNVQFSAAAYQSAENAGMATIAITRANGNASDIVVQYNTSDGTAQAGQDYTAVTGSVTFGPNELTKSFVVPIINDQINESDTETVDLSITSVLGGATVGSPIAVVLNIVDDDAALAPFDFDGDGKTDLSIFRPNGAEWWWLKSSNGSNGAVQFGTPSDHLVPSDYTGDGKMDVAFWRPSTGQWFVLRSEDFSFYAFPFGANGDVPVPGDYDGDGKADAAVFRESSLTWFISKSNGGTDIVTFGAAGDKPVHADYDGDGKADIAIFRPIGANGAEWWIRRSSSGAVFAAQFGAATDKAVAGDYTGDGKADIAFWTPSSGNWFVLRSEDFSYYAFPFGSSADVPVPGDYDGDGKLDAAVFRPSTSTWFANRSTAGVLIQQFGSAGDLPVPSAFIR